MKYRILIVEDSLTQAEALRALLEEAGYEVATARSGEEALELMSGDPPDMVLSDVVMPGIDGCDLSRRIRGNPGWRDVPVVLLTSLSDPMNIIRGLECGADNYITKPYDPDYLLARLRHVVDNRRLRRGSKTSMGVSVRFLGRDLNITSDKEQILDLFISTVEEVVRANQALERSQRELAEAHARLEAYAEAKEMEARISTGRYRALLQSAGDAIFVVDRDGGILEANQRAAELLKRPLGELLAHPFQEFLADGERSAFRAELAGITPERQMVMTERRLVGPKGAELSWELTGSSTTVDGEDLVLLIGRDITERKHTETALREREAAERANRAKNEFLSRMSHELRTPLNAILGFGQLLEREVEGEANKESVEQILHAGRHLLSLVGEVLDLAKVEADRMQVSLEPVRVGDLMSESVDLIESLARQNEIELHVAPDWCDEYARADRQRVKQVMLNLLSNAVKYNEQGGSVFVSCRPDEPAGSLRITVEDTGPGIPMEKMGMLFTPFERLGAERTGVPGTGLGLSLSKGLIESMGGKMGVRSTPGEGCRFWIDLPRETAPPVKEIAERQPVSEPQPNFTGPRTVLYIEDNLSNVRLVERILSRYRDITLVPAMQGSLGLDLARERRPDLVLLDLHLPDMRGTEVLRRLTSDPELSGTPVVVISAEAGQGTVDQLLEIGAREYLMKPFEISRLMEVLERHLTLNGAE